ncbi:MAG: metal-dependent transcriptional regulator [Canibacter sp.]
MAQYLKTIWVLQEEETTPVSVGALTIRLERSPATVSQTIRTLAAVGLVSHQRYGPISLTESGRGKAAMAVRRERIARVFLTRILGWAWPNVAEEAARLSPVLTEALANRMYEFAETPVWDPYGNPIPDERGYVSAVVDDSLHTFPRSLDLRICRVDERDQALLLRFHTLGLVPGAIVRIKHVDRHTGVITVSTSKHAVTIGLGAAARVYAVAESSVLPTI